MNPRFPVFIPTKNRQDSRLTIKMFDELNVPYTIFVEPQQVELYAPHVDRDRIHVLPHSDKGLTVTRNYIWDYAESCGHEWFWTFDDNIDGLFRFNHNLKVRCADGTLLYAVEDFVQRYENVVISGFNYDFFVKRKFVVPPYTLNTRIYSNMLIKTNARDRNGNKFRNVTFFNDDTDLCLRVLKDGQCTVLWNAFLIGKKTTMTIKGGMTDYYLKTDNRREFAEELQQAHPDCVEVVEKWGRIHHHINYQKFKHQLKRRAGVEIPRGVNNFSMVLQERSGDSWTDVVR
jgi:hypothetical protein